MNKIALYETLSQSLYIGLQTDYKRHSNEKRQVMFTPPPAKASVYDKEGCFLRFVETLDIFLFHFCLTLLNLFLVIRLILKVNKAKNQQSERSNVGIW